METPGPDAAPPHCHRHRNQLLWTTNVVPLDNQSVIMKASIQDSGTRDTSPFNELEARSKLPPESHTSPWLVFFHDNCQTFFSISEDSFYVRSIDDMKNHHDCWPTVQGWVLMKKPKSRECFLLNPATLEKTELQPLEWGLSRNCKCVLSAPPDDPNFMVLVANLNDHCLYFCRPRDATGKQYWKRQKKEEHYIMDILVLNGTFYVHTLSLFGPGFAMIRFLPHLSLMVLEQRAFRFSVGLDCCHKTFMLESCGDIFCVIYFTDGLEDDGKKVTHVEVEKRNSVSHTWNVVDNIGGRVFFLGVDNFAASWSATELGVKGNCIYITKKDDKHMYVFDMEEGTLCVGLPCPNLPENCSQPFWMLL